MKIPDIGNKTHLLKGKVILVTGAHSDIGQAVSMAAASQGATIVLLDKNIPKLELLYDEIEANGYPQPAIYPMDLSGASLKDFQDLADNIEQEFQLLDGIVHAETLLGSLMPLDQYNLEHWTRVMQVNLHAPFIISRFCLPLLDKARYASIIFNSDDVGHQGKAYWGAYAISKAGVYNLMQIMADELEVNTRIRVNCINPGKIANELRAQAYPGEDPGPLPTASDITDSYIYLLSELAVDIHGQEIKASEQV